MIGLYVLIAFIVILSSWLYLFKPRQRDIPGMKKTSKKEGNLSDIQKAGNFFDFLKQLHAKYGSIASFWYGEVYTVSIASPELFKQHTHPFDRPVLFFKLFEPLIGTSSIQYANGDDGHTRRKTYDRAFAHDKLSSYYETIQKSVDLVVKQWSAKEADDLIPLCDETFKFTVRSSLCTMLGEYFEDDDVVYSFRKAYVKVQEELGNVIADPTLCEKAEAIEPFNKALGFMKTTVKNAVEYRKQRTSQGNLVIDEILELATSEDMLMSDSITYLVGAFHNTGNMLAFCLYYLAINKDIQDKLYKEIMDVLGHSRLVDDSSLKNLRYMRQVIDEATRCGTFGAFAARTQETETELGGYKIPKNTPVIQAIGVVMRDEKLWPSPDKFDPENFNEENRKNRHPYAFQPFGFAGKRKCPGYKMVYMTSAVFLATLLQRFQILPHGDKQVVIEHGLATHPAEEIWVKITKR